ncbi:hypothetical protein SNEBB_007393 [Seison nebaliae]|nr:hypothetical protein SNEBB_007393 [Seison nebaliae]
MSLGHSKPEIYRYNVHRTVNGMRIKRNSGVGDMLIKRQTNDQMLYGQFGENNEVRPVKPVELLKERQYKNLKNYRHVSGEGNKSIHNRNKFITIGLTVLGIFVICIIIITLLIIKFCSRKKMREENRNVNNSEEMTWLIPSSPNSVLSGYEEIDIQEMAKDEKRKKLKNSCKQKCSKWFCFCLKSSEPREHYPYECLIKKNEQRPPRKINVRSEDSSSSFTVHSPNTMSSSLYKSHKQVLAERISRFDIRLDQMDEEMDNVMMEKKFGKPSKKYKNFSQNAEFSMRSSNPSSGNMPRKTWSKRATKKKTRLKNELAKIYQKIDQSKNYTKDQKLNFSEFAKDGSLSIQNLFALLSIPLESQYKNQSENLAEVKKVSPHTPIVRDNTTTDVKVNEEFLETTFNCGQSSPIRLNERPIIEDKPEGVKSELKMMNGKIIYHDMVDNNHINNVEENRHQRKKKLSNGISQNNPLLLEPNKNVQTASPLLKILEKVVPNEEKIEVKSERTPIKKEPTIIKLAPSDLRQTKLNKTLSPNEIRFNMNEESSGENNLQIQHGLIASTSSSQPSPTHDWTNPDILPTLDEMFVEKRSSSQLFPKQNNHYSYNQMVLDENRIQNVLNEVFEGSSEEISNTLVGSDYQDTSSNGTFSDLNIFERFSNDSSDETLNDAEGPLEFVRR